MKVEIAALALSLGASNAALVKRSEYSELANLLQFDNLGFEGKYFPVTHIEALNSENCSCTKDLDNPYIFEGPIAPLNEELSVQVRGPMNLLKFGWYYSESYNFGQTTGNWTRGAYYDAVEGTADNVTFLANYGSDNVCLGKALSYLDETGMDSANESTILSNVSLPSSREFTIMSSIKCSDDDCGAYRSDSEAYHGYYGVNKMFLFEFNAPTDNSEENLVNKTDTYDMPAIWLLNAQIPRTSQYPLNPNCSAWNSGAGEFDIFEVMNVTERNHFYTTLHDYQGTDDIGTGIQNHGYLERTPNATMLGGVVFGEDGTASVFLSNSTSLDSVISNSDLNSWLQPLEEGTMKAETLSTISLASTVSTIKTSKSKGDAGMVGSIGSGILSTVLALVMALI